MKRRIVSALLSWIFVLCLVCELTACGLFTEKEHEHVFCEHNTDEAYLKSAATCTTRAEYYYSCSCGLRGEEVFVGEKALGHTGGNATCSDPAVCERCGERYGKTAPNGHSYSDGVCSLCGEPQTSGLKYTLSSDGTYYSVSKGGSSAEKVYIPSRHNGKPVKVIEANAFANCKNLTSVIIPSSVTRIGSGAFSECKNLTDITIPGSVTGIDSGAFSGCKELAAITIPDSVTSISNSLFCDCWKLTSITLPDTVTGIGSDAFRNCSALREIALPSSITSIGNAAFRNCTGLTDIVINSVATLSSNLFDGCVSLTNVTIGSVTTIGAGAFIGCTKLTTLTIPSSLTNIGNQAFYACENLSDVYYMGSEEQWELVTIGFNNNELINANMHFQNR